MSQLKIAIVPVTAFQQNCTLIWDDETNEGVVIDPGGDLDRIKGAIDEIGMKVTAIWLTHGHIDHAAGAMDLSEALGVDIIGPHKDDTPLLEGLEQQAKMFGLDGTVRNVTPTRWLEEGDTLSIGDHEFAVYHCPGHAPGHVVFYNAKAGFAHVGDVLFDGSIGRTDLPGGDHETLIKSIKTKLMAWPDEVQFICGHGPASSIGKERATNPFLN
ncbi:MBL fold metallo-hydrolase [Pseudahrensia aquimaris]|uniref:MBL fold metallo-hydrolase n=1 Tax=Pseudahrensia aquimaris TaxID=744461 RepID=A0ABW3FDU7_9HYPH